MKNLGTNPNLMTTRASLQALALLCTAPASFAANLYWDNAGGTANDWSSLPNWSTVVGGGTDPLAVPGASDLAIFSATSVASAQTVNLNADRTVTGLSFTSSQAHSLLGGGTNRTLTLGASGIEKSGAGAATIGSATAGQQVPVTINGAQTWSNINNTGAIVVHNNVTPLSTGSGTTLTLGGTSTAANQINGVIANNTTTGVTSVTKTGAGLWVLGNTTTAVANSFTGNVTINGGTLRVDRPTATATLTTLGTGAVAVNSGATLHFLTGSTGNNLTHANNITLSSGTIFFEDGNTVLSGAVGLSGSSTIRGRWNDKNLTMSGVVSGTGGITKTNTSSTGSVELILSGNNSFSSAATGGVLTVNGGYVRLASAGALGNTPTIFANNTLGTGSTVGVRLAGGITIGAGRTLILRNGPALANDQRAALDNVSGNNAWSGSIVLESPVAGVRNQTLNSASGTTLTINGNIYNSATLPSGGMFVRGSGNGVINGNLFLGGGMFLKTDGGTWTVNSTGNTQGSTTVAVGGMVLNNTNALEPGKALTLGQTDAQNATLTINGGFSQHFSTIDTATGTNGSHTIGGAGTLDTGSVAVPVTVSDGTAADDLTIATAIGGTGGITKAGAGTLFLNGNTASGPVAVSAGTLRGSATVSGGLSMGTGTTLTPGSATTAGTITTNALALNDGTLAVNLGSGGSDVIDVTGPGGLTQSGTTTVNISPLGALNTSSTFYPIVSYTGASPGTSGFSLGALPPRVAGSITDNGSAIGLTATNDQVRWTGATNATWDINTTQNWQTVAGATATNYLQGDDLIFTDAGGNTAITLGVPVSPMAVDFQNTSGGPAYSLSGAGALTGPMTFDKTGTGTVTLNGSAAHSYTGATTLAAGTLEVNAATSNLTGTSGVDVASGATLRLFSGNANFTFNRALTGTGTVTIDPNASGTAGSRDITFSGANSGFGGTLRLQPTGSGGSAGTFRTVSSTNQGHLGSATIQVKDGAQLWYSGSLNNPIEITGTGYAEGAGGTPHGSTGFSYGGIGAIRMEGTLSGPITLVGNAKIMPYNTTHTISGPIGGTGILVAGGSSSNVNSTLILTGANNYNGATWINGNGSAGSGGTDALIVGNNTTTGSLGTGDVTLNATASRGALIRFARSDGYTLGAGQDILANVAASADYARTNVSANTTGSGLSLNGNTVDISDGTNGGTLHVAGQNGGSGVNGAILNIDGGATVDVGNLHVGDASGFAGTVNQSNSGSTVSVINQVRIGHYSNNTSAYDLTGGTFSVTGANPVSNPFAGGEQNGGIYLGIDGTGVLNQSGGTVNTNFVVLDNRGNTAGVDQYNLNGGTLNLKNTWGISGNASTLLTLGGGTLRVDNAGPVTVPVSVPATVTGTASILDTGVSGNAFTFGNDIAGTGTVTVQGGGTLNLSTTGTQNVSAVIAGTSPLTKLGTGATTLAGANTYNGGTTVSEGRLNLAGGIPNSALSVANGGSLGGEGTAATVTFGSTGTDTTGLFVDGVSSGALTSTGALTVNGTVNVDLTSAPAGAGAITVLNHGGTTATPANFALVNAANYRGSTFTVGGSNVTVDISKKNLAWDGTTATWEIGGTENDWNDVANDNFFTGDQVTFGDSFIAGNQSIDMTGALQPSAVIFSGDSFDYELTGTAGNGITGPAAVSKTGDALVTLGGDNTFSGGLTISNGMVNLASATALGANGGQITVAAGGQLNYKGTNVSASGRTYSVTIAGDGSDGFGDGAITNDTAGLNQNAGIVNLTLSGNATVGTYGGTLPNGNRIDFGLGGAINGNGFTFTKKGEAMVAVRGPATNISYLVSEGTLRAEDHDLAFGSTGVQVNTGATLDSWSARTFAVPVTFQHASTLLCSNSTANWTGPLTLEGDITLGGAATINITQPFAETGTGLITKTGAGNVILPAGQTFDRKVNVTAGILRIPADDALGVVPGAPLADSITLQTGGRIQAGNSGTGVDLTLDSNRGVTLASGDGGFHPWTGFTLTYGGTVTGPGNLTKTDGGTWVFTGTANHTGGTTFSAGTTNLNAASITSGNSFNVTGGTTNLNTGSVVTTGGNTNLGTGTLNIAGGALTTDRLILDEGGNTSSTVNHSSGTVTITGTNSSNNNTASFLFGHWGSGNTATYNLSGGALNSTGAELSFGWDSTNSLFNQTGGTANLLGLDFGNGRSNNAVYSLNGGRLNLGANGMTTNASKTFNLGSGTLGAFANWSSGQAISMTGTATPATVDTLDSVDGTTARTITLSGALSGSGGLVKAGNGTLVLSATNTYTGTTTVNAGTLLVNTGSLGNTIVTVASVGTLGGNGSIAGATTVQSGGTLAPGNSVGTLTFGTTVGLEAGSTYAVEITGATTHDKVTATGIVTASGDIAVTLNGYVPVAGDTFDIVDASSIAGTPTFDFTNAVLTAGLVWDTSSFATNGQIKVIGDDPFTGWATLYGVTGGKNGDDDNDGESNLLEFATNSHPANGSSRARVYGKMHVLGGDNVLTYTVAVRKNATFATGSPDASKQEATKDKVKYSIEGSNELGIWNSVVVTELAPVDAASVQAAITPALPTLDADWEWHTFRTDGGATADPKDFIRLNVTEAP